MSKQMELSDHVTEICRRALKLPALHVDEDFFDRGANSLTIVELQLQIERVLNVSVPTSKLMLDSSIAGWIKAFEAASAKQGEPVAS